MYILVREKKFSEDNWINTANVEVIKYLQTVSHCVEVSVILTTICIYISTLPYACHMGHVLLLSDECYGI